MTTTPSKPPVFGNSVLLFILLALAGLCGAFAAYQREAARNLEDELRISAVVGGLVGAMTIPLLIGWIAYWIGRRSTRAARITACVLAILFIFSNALAGLGAKVGATRRIQEAQRARDLADQLRAGNHASAEALKRGDGDASLKAAESNQAVLEKSSASLTGDRKTVAECMNEYVTDILAARKHFDAGLADFKQAGGAAPASLTTPAAIQAHLDAIDKMESAAREFSTTYDNGPESTRTKLVARGVKPADVDAAVNGMRLAPEIHERMKKVSSLNLERCTQLRRLIGVLKDHAADWKFEPAAGIVFADAVPADAIQAYNDAVDRVVAIDAEQAKIAAELGQLQSNASR